MEAMHLPSLRGRLGRVFAAAALCFVSAQVAEAQVVVYRPVVPMFAPAAGPYVANYTPAGNYAAVTAFTPAVVQTAAMPVVSAPVVASMPTSSVAVTSYYAPAVAAPTYIEPTYAAPAATTAYYAPSAVATTSYYAPAPVSTTYVEPAVVAAPVTTYYAPAAVAVPLYRRGLFGGLRPVRAAYYPYY
jgi:hypothetical protein